MRTDAKLTLYQKYATEADKQKIFSVYAFVFNSLYYLSAGMFGWFTLYFFGSLFLIVCGFAIFGSLWVAPAIWLITRLISAFTAEKLRLKHINAFIARNQDVNYSKPITFYQLPVKKLVIASILSCGIFELYWMYKNWKAVRQDVKDNEIYPAFQSWLLGAFFIWPLLKIIRLNLTRSKTEGSKYIYFAVGYTACWWIQILLTSINMFWIVPYAAAICLWLAYLAFWFAGIVFLAAIQKRINFHNSKTNRKSEMPKGWNRWEIAVVVIGLVLNAIAFGTQTAVTQNDPNLGIALSSTYRMMEGYPSFCGKQGVKMEKFPKVYAEYFAPEIKVINEHLKPYNLNMQQAWEFFRVRLNNVLDESIMSEFMALKPVIINEIVEQYKKEQIENFDEVVAREYLEKEITFPVLCSETDNNAFDIIDSNETYKSFLRDTVAKIR